MGATNTFSTASTAAGIVAMLALLGALIGLEVRHQRQLPGLSATWRSAVVLVALVLVADIVLRFAVLAHGL
jgi:hypothetical protein